jgi:hypothetical protein
MRESKDDVPWKIEEEEKEEEKVQKHFGIGDFS